MPQSYLPPIVERCLQVSEPWQFGFGAACSERAAYKASGDGDSVEIDFFKFNDVGLVAFVRPPQSCLRAGSADDLLQSSFFGLHAPEKKVSPCLFQYSACRSSHALNFTSLSLN